MIEIVVKLSRAQIINANDRMHWRAKAAKVATIRQLAAIAARGTKPLDVRSRIAVEFRYPNKVRPSDAMNLADTVKPLVDGIVTDAGVLPDDSDTWVESTSIRINPDTYRHDPRLVYVLVTIIPA